MATESTIRIGYEIGTGAPVDIPLGHLVVTGQTQQSGKTTTLEALISRSLLRAIVFRTKRAESAFFGVGRDIRPYFSERADWQFVSAILEATFREKMKFERAWIMRVCKGARTLAEVRRNIEAAIPKAKGLNADMYYRLAEYLDIVLPQLRALPAADRVELEAGLNVMDLSGYTSEMQALVIRSVIQWVNDRENNTVVVIPEAWEFVPEGRGSPVKLAAEHLIRKGGAAGNFIWLDSQDLAGVDAVLRKAISVWIMGVQRADVEVKRLLAHLPASAAKPNAAEVMQLGLGEFFISYGRELKKVYVQPAWDKRGEVACQVAKGEVSAFALVPHSRHPHFGYREPDDDEPAEVNAVEDAVWRERYLEEKARANELQRRVLALEAEAKRRDPSATVAVAAAAAVAEEPTNGAHESVDELYDRLLSRLLREPQLLKVTAAGNEIEVIVHRKVISMDGDTLRGAIARLVASRFFTEARGASEVKNELNRRGSGSALPNVCKELDKLTEMGFLFVEGPKGQRRYLEVEGMVVNIVGAAA